MKNFSRAFLYFIPFLFLFNIPSWAVLNARQLRLLDDALGFMTSGNVPAQWERLEAEGIFSDPTDVDRIAEIVATTHEKKSYAMIPESWVGLGIILFKLNRWDKRAEGLFSNGVDFADSSDGMNREEVPDLLLRAPHLSTRRLWRALGEGLIRSRSDVTVLRWTSILAARIELHPEEWIPASHSWNFFALSERLSYLSSAWNIKTSDIQKLRADFSLLVSRREAECRHLILRGDLENIAEGLAGLIKLPAVQTRTAQVILAAIHHSQIPPEQLGEAEIILRRVASGSLLEAADTGIYLKCLSAIYESGILNVEE